MKKSILFLFLFSFFCFSTKAQRIITGTISEAATGILLPGVHILHEHENSGTISDTLGQYRINWDIRKGALKFSFPGCQTILLTPGESDTLDVVLKLNEALLQIDTVITFDPETYEEQIMTVRNDLNLEMMLGSFAPQNNLDENPISNTKNWNTEDYSAITENTDKNPFHEPLSTFSIDVDNASYSNVRRFLNQHQRPPIDAVRIEEMINYFDYQYPQPKGKHPFSITTELSDCPWNEDRQLLLIGIQGKDIEYEKLPPANLVFLLDVSGSMRSENKLPLVKSAMKLLVHQLREEDQISIVVYAGAAGLVLPPTSGVDKTTILEALDRLQAGGSTAGGAGINLAYKIAKENFLAQGNNRVILCTDGDFNIGASSDAEMQRLIEEKRKDNIFLTVLGFGIGNFKDNKLELLADKGNGNYAYIDQFSEAKKVFVQELGANLFTIAKDVKIQAEFNPKYVKSYRLVGYENRLLNKEDFNDDTKDAGELGASHQVTALYELTLHDDTVPIPSADVRPLRFQNHSLTRTATKSKELVHIQFRYKPIGSEQSEWFSKNISNKKGKLEKVSDNFRLASAVASFGMILRGSGFNKNLDRQKIEKLIADIDADPFGYQREMVELVGKWAAMDSTLEK